MSDWGDVPTWVQAVGTVATLGFLSWQIGGQSDQVNLTRRQVDDQGKYNAAQIDLLRKQVEDERAFNKAQMRVLELQAEELMAAREYRNREAGERRRAQAAKVFLECHHEMVHGHGPGVAKVARYMAVVTNSSEQPIYNVFLIWHIGSADWEINGSSKDGKSSLMPGEKWPALREWIDGSPPVGTHAVVEFDDANVVRWQRRKEGTLTELNTGIPTGEGNSPVQES